MYTHKLQVYVHSTPGGHLSLCVYIYIHLHAMLSQNKTYIIYVCVR